MDSTLGAAFIGVLGVVIGALVAYMIAIRQQNLEKQREYYIAYIESVSNLKKGINVQSAEAYEKARTDLLMLGSVAFIKKMHEYEGAIIKENRPLLTPIDEAEREIILQSRRDLHLSVKGFPKDIYMFNIRVK